MLYLILLSLFIFQRLYEMRLGQQHLQVLAQRLLVPIDPRDRIVMLLLHSSWFVALSLEYLWHGELVEGWSLIIGLIGLAVMQIMRLASMRALGVFWVPFPVSFQGQKRVSHGPYRWCRHPNYLAVVGEFLLLPWLGGCYLVMVIASVLNAFFLIQRIQKEEAALALLQESP